MTLSHNPISSDATNTGGGAGAPLLFSGDKKRKKDRPEKKQGFWKALRPVLFKGIKLFVLLFSILVFVCAGIGIYLYMQLTSVNIPELRHGHPNMLDEQEASRKLVVFQGALKNQKVGLVRFSEVELNSFIRYRFFGSDKALELSDSILLERCWVILGEEEFVWVTTLNLNIKGHPIRVIWHRVVGQPRLENGHWVFPVKEMTIGKQWIPQQFWGMIQRELQPVDDYFQKDFNWLSSLPRLFVREDTTIKQPALWLQTVYSEIR